jgi:hypothetical protein
MNLVIFIAAIVLSNSASAITCLVMTYDNQQILARKTISSSVETVHAENGITYKIVIQSDGRYSIVTTYSNNQSVAAMTQQRQELTFADETLNRIVACK